MLDCMTRFERWPLACAPVLVALVGLRLLHPRLDAATLLVFVGAIAVSSAAFGLGPALLATGLAIVLVDFFFMAPIRSFAVLVGADFAALVLLGGVAVLVSGLFEHMRRRLESARRDAVEAARLIGFLQRYTAALEAEVDARRGSER